jgi:hypothetical protein
MQKEYGEPGFYFVDDADYGANPCVEIGLAPFLTVDAESRAALAGTVARCGRGHAVVGLADVQPHHDQRQRRARRAEEFWSACRSALRCWARCRRRTPTFAISAPSRA